MKNWLGDEWPENPVDAKRLTAENLEWLNGKFFKPRWSEKVIREELRTRNLQLQSDFSIIAQRTHLFLILAILATLFSGISAIPVIVDLFK